MGGAWWMCGALLATPNRPQRRVLTEHKQDISWIFAVVLYLERHLTWSCEGGGSKGGGWWRIGRKRRQVEGRSYSTHLRALEHCPTNKLREHKRNKPIINKRIETKKICALKFHVSFMNSRNILLGFNIQHTFTWGVGTVGQVGSGVRCVSSRETAVVFVTVMMVCRQWKAGVERKSSASSRWAQRQIWHEHIRTRIPHLIKRSCVSV